ncbi:MULTISPECIES: DUF1223 domain-containing protein [unclassified Xanthobacter]|uniref:DUF1223 domain-containing protein n=1 Tax=unclassified Xanthobacter TaxID=2623496 RepID=UPI001EE102AA|nr:MULTISPECIES: DUF1223 domain-containing protein [unclassified Xanthobacter]
MIPFRSAFLLAFALAATPAAAQSQPRAVVELFTSQGCSSCPPADALLSELAKDPDIIALTMPVDYWDYIGWKDTLALHGHSMRQKAYADRRADHKVFTPQAIVDGVVAVKGSDKPALQRALLERGAAPRGLPVALKLERAGENLEIEASPAAVPPEGAEFWACPVARSKTVAIGRGENGGRSVTYSNVVRGWVKIGRWDGSSSRLHIKLASLEREDADAVVILLQAGSPAAPGPILGAATFPLK